MHSQRGARVIDWELIQATEPFMGVRRQTIVTSTSTIVRYTYAPGSIFPSHDHPDEQTTVVHSGAIEFDIAGERHLLGAGQVAVIPGDVPHGARVVGDEVVVTDNYFASSRRAPLALRDE